MEKNDFLLYNEIIYHIHTCQDMDDLKLLYSGPGEADDPLYLCQPDCGGD